MKKKLIPILAVIFAVALLFVACSKSDNGEINDIFAELKAGDVVFAGNSYESVDITEEEYKANIGEIPDTMRGYNSKFEKVTAQTSFDDLTNFGLDDDIFWPGALVKVGIAGTSKQDSIKPLRLGRAPMTLSLNTEGATGITYEPQVVEKPALSSSRAAVNKMVQQTQVQGAQLSLKLAAQMTEIKSTNDLSVALNVDVKTLPVTVKNNFEMNMKSNQTNAILMLKQIYYTVDMDAPNSPAALFNESVTSTDFQKSIEAGEVPAYVASVIYGRTVIVQISSSMSFLEIQNKLNVDVNYMVQVGTELEAGINSLDESTAMNYFIYGGSVAGNQTVLSQTKVNDIIKALNENYDPTKMVGVPISYKLRYLDGSICKVNSVNEYYVQTITPKPIDTAEIEVEEVIDDGKGNLSLNLRAINNNKLHISLKTGINDFGQFEPSMVINNVPQKFIQAYYDNDGKGEYSYEYDISSVKGNIRIIADIGIEPYVRHAELLIGEDNQSYKLTFNTNGGSSIASITDRGGTSISKPTDPKKDGYIFDGWYANSYFSNVVSFPFTLLDNTTIYAKWTPIKYRVICKAYQIPSNGSIIGIAVGLISLSDIFDGYIDYDESKNITAPTISGKTFKEWRQGESVYSTNSTITLKNLTKVNEEVIYIYAWYTDNTCVAEGTLITLADGSQKAVEQLDGSELLLVWDFQTGSYTAAPIVFIESSERGEFEVIQLFFSDGTDVKVIGHHAYWNFDLEKYVTFYAYNAEQYIGQWFKKQANDLDGYERVQLVDVKVYKEFTSAWSPVTFHYLNFYTNGMLSMPGAVTPFMNIFEVNSETISYDKEKMQVDIEMYGLFTYQDLEHLVPEIVFDAFAAQYLKVAIGKGMMDMETIEALVERFSEFFKLVQ